MKCIKSISVCVLLLLCVGCKQSPKQIEGGYLLTVSMKDYSEPYIYWRNGEALDSALVENGSFTLTKKLENPARVRFTAKKNREQAFTIYLENSVINAQVDFSKNRFTDPEFLKVTGSEAHELYRKINWDVIKYSNKKYEGASKLALAKYKTNAFYYLFQGNPEYINDIGFDEVYAYFVYNLPTKHFPYEEAEKLLELFKDKYSDNKRYKGMQRIIEIASNRKIGTPFIDYAVKNSDDKEIKIKDFYGSSYTLIDIWASWCGPCRKENPNYKKALKLYKDKGFEIIAVSLDNDKQRWLDAIREDKTYGFVQVSELKGRRDLLSKTYGINGIPDNFLLDKDGNIIDNALRGEDLFETLEHLFAK